MKLRKVSDILNNTSIKEHVLGDKHSALEYPFATVGHPKLIRIRSELRLFLFNVTGIKRIMQGCDLIGKEKVIPFSANQVSALVFLDLIVKVASLIGRRSDHDHCSDSRGEHRTQTLAQLYIRNVLRLFGDKNMMRLTFNL